MKPGLFFILLLLALLGFNAARLFAADPAIPQRFYVESVEFRGGKDRVMYLWRDGKRLRYEACAGTQMVKTFVDPDANRTVGLFDEVRQYVVVPYSRVISGGGSGELVFDVLFSENAIFKPLGEAQVGESMCMKYRVYADGEGCILCWVDKRSKIPLKLSDENGQHEVFWRNFSPDVPISGLFSIPAGYSEKK